jgi:hypothetical protein
VLLWWLPDDWHNPFDRFCLLALLHLLLWALSKASRNGP